MTTKIEKTDAEWRAELTTEQYEILRRKGTERAFTGEYNDMKDPGVYRCAGCGTELFRSEAKFDSGSGWPSFVEPASLESVVTETDRSFGMKRTEVMCATCGGHLGHVFPDGPGPDGTALLHQLLLARPGALVNAQVEKATFAAGCFWGVEVEFRNTPGVKNAEVGYIGGETANPTYKEVCSGRTGHAEAVEVTFDPSEIEYSELVDRFWKLHDPTQKNRQGWDVGTQYRSAIFTHSPAQAQAARESLERAQAGFRKSIATQIVTDQTPFWPAEEYHQQYLVKNGRASCAI